MTRASAYNIASAATTLEEGEREREREYLMSQFACSNTEELIDEEKNYSIMLSWDYIIDLVRLKTDRPHSLQTQQTNEQNYIIRLTKLMLHSAV